VSANPELPLRPKIAILIDEFGDKLQEEKVIDLQERTKLFITKPLSKDYVKKILSE
jgi:hypothetical protein